MPYNHVSSESSIFQFPGSWVNDAENNPHDDPWWKQEERDQAVEQMISPTPLLDDDGGLSGSRLCGNNDGRVRLLLCVTLW